MGTLFFEYIWARHKAKACKKGISILPFLIMLHQYGMDIPSVSLCLFP
jgi:hypothetical protein